MAKARLLQANIPRVVTLDPVIQYVGEVLFQAFVRDLKQTLRFDQSSSLLILAAVLGTILSFVPAPVLDSLLVGFILTRFKQVNRPILLAARLLWNDLLVVPLYMPGYRLGLLLLEPLAFNFGPTGTRLAAFLIGVAILMSVAAIISAALVVLLVATVRRRRSQAH